MTILPVIAREMRAAARQPFTYWVRAMGVGALLLATLSFAMDIGIQPNLGGELFARLNLTLFLAIWILVPMLTADCISRERREGTLGLLFLTGLSASDIVVAKGLSHGLRALTLWLAVLPAMMIPVLMGGVSWDDSVRAILADVCALSGALAAGLVASTRSKQRLQTLIWAVFLAAAFLFVLGRWAGAIWYSGTTISIPVHPLNAAALAFRFVPDSMAGSYPLGSRFSRTPLRPVVGLPLWGMAQLVTFSLLALAFGVLIAGAKIRRVWQEEPPSRLRLWWERVFCTPIFWRGFFRRWLNWKLRRNPIGWLEQRTWTGRLVTWSWLAVVVSLYSAILSDPNFSQQYSVFQKLIGWLMAVSMAMTAAGSFRRERETGLMELLLVSPLSEQQIILGRLRGLWGQFLPAGTLLLGIWVLFSTFPNARKEPEAILLFVSTYLTLPVIGLYYSLRCRTFIVAFVATLAVGLVLPFVLSWMFYGHWLIAFYQPYSELPFSFSTLACGCQLLLAVRCALSLYHRLRTRSFLLGRQEG